VASGRSPVASAARFDRVERLPSKAEILLPDPYFAASSLTASLIARTH